MTSIRQVTSYGGELSYTVRYTTTSFAPRLSSGADVIIHGSNGQRLYTSYFTRAFADVETEARIPLREDTWRVQEFSDRRPSRQEFLYVLQNIEYILIKSNYDPQQSEVRSVPQLRAFVLFSDVLPSFQSFSLNTW